MLKRCIDIGIFAVLSATLGCSHVQTAIAPVASRMSATATPPELEAAHRHTIQLMQEQQWRKAETGLVSLTSQYPEPAGPWLNLGITRMNLGDSDGAEIALQTAIDKNRENPVSYNKLGILYRQTGQLDKALEMYKKALEVSPDFPDTHWNIAILYEVFLSQADLALQHYVRYQQLTQSNDPDLKIWISILMKETSKNGV